MDAENPILKARKSLKMTQTEMARELGVNLSTIWRWEKDQLPISPVVARAVEQLVSERAA
jgi:DNA-binding XRE family transcriptional regulator